MKPFGMWGGGTAYPNQKKGNFSFMGMMGRLGESSLLVQLAFFATVGVLIAIDDKIRSIWR